MAVSEKEKMEIIEEYVKQEKLKKLQRRVLVKPLFDASEYFTIKLRERNLWWKDAESYRKLHFKRKLKEAIWGVIVKSVCEKYGLSKITDLPPEFYEEANDYAIELLDMTFGI